MAGTGIFMVLFLVAHMVGNLKVFSGAEKFNDYSLWLRNLGHPVLPESGFLWIMRVALLVAVALHITAAVQLTHRSVHDRQGRRSRKGPHNYVAFTMRSGGVILTLFVVWHILDFTTLTVNTNAVEGQAYQNLVASFSTWYGDVIYIVAMLALGFHLQHGIWSASQTLGMGTTVRNRVIRPVSAVVGVLVAVGFVVIPISVMTGMVS